MHTERVQTNVQPSRQSLVLPPELARQVQDLARSRRVSVSRLLTELVEAGIKAQIHKERVFLELGERFRAATDPDEVQRLGSELGQAVFGD